MEEITTQRVTLRVADGTSMNAYTALPVGDGKCPGMLVFQEAFGVNAHIRDITERLARQGYVAIAPELFHRTAPGFEGSYTDFSTVMPHMQAMKEENSVQDIQAAYQWLKSNAQVTPDRIASIGFCMGGRMSFLACSVVQLRAAISFYGGGIAPAILPRAANLSGPILFFWGGLDQHIPTEQIRSVVDELKRVGKQFINVEISDADHGFFCDVRASYNATAAMLARTLSLKFLDTHVKGIGEKGQGA